MSKILSAIILVGWQYFYSVPMIEKQKAEQAAKTAQTTQTGAAPTPGAAPGSAPSPAGAAGTNAPLPAGTQAAASREAALAASPRVKIES